MNSDPQHVPTDASLFLERLLNPNELPANIVLKKFQQYGYEAQDGIELLGGDDFAFLFKFCYKSQLLGPPVSIPHLD